MAEEFSFDIVSQVNLQEVENAVNQASKEIGTRFDFRGSLARIEWDKKGGILTLLAEDESRLKGVIEVFQGKLSKRGVSLKSLNFGTIEPAERGSVRQQVTLQQGIPQDKARTLIQMIKQAGLKVQAGIQGDHIRVSSKSKDALQATMTLVSSKDVGLPLQFVNYR
ncbi:MAG: YajQ family cyclic di-GMP-binding protein [Elusimicrobia bacterium]|nr:YajQ family cyclic di-GMP-binding protein [Elusimicrobiota bacterium]